MNELLDYTNYFAKYFLDNISFDQLATWPTFVLGILFVIGILLCFFGYSLFRIIVTIDGALLGLIFGIAFYAHTGTPFFLVIVFATIGLLLAFIFYKVGIFIYVFLHCLLVGIFMQEILISIIVGIILGIVFVILNKYIIAIITSLNGGALAGISISIIMKIHAAAIPISVVLIALGCWLQIKHIKKKNEANEAIENDSSDDNV